MHSNINYEHYLPIPQDNCSHYEISGAQSMHNNHEVLY